METPQQRDVIEQESPQTELMVLQDAGDPEVSLVLLEKKVELAARFKAAIETLLVIQTYPEDWTEQDDTMCLSSAGAERVGRQFNIQFFETKWRKEDFTDSVGKGYRYIYETKAAWEGRTTFAQGIYSTRQPFLCKTDGAYRDVTEISEEDIQRAACNIMRGNAIKCLLGIRGLPKSEWVAIMERARMDPSRAKKVARDKGTKGGNPEEDKPKQAELANICMSIAHAGKSVKTEDYKTFALRSLDAKEAKLPGMELAKAICVALSSFKGDKDVVEGKGAKDLKGKWLDSALAKAKVVFAELEGVAK
jgi:hypothetical protein